MFSGLYGDLPQAKDEGEKKPEGTPGSWSGSTLLVPPTKRAAVAMPPPSVVLRGANSRGRGRDTSSRGRGRNAASSTKAQAAAATETSQHEMAVPSNAPFLPQQQPSFQSLPGPAAPASIFGDGVDEEYDPARPNDYASIRRRIEQQRLEAEAESERQERLREIRELEELERRRDEEDAAQRGHVPSSTPSQQQRELEAREETRQALVKLSGDEAYLRRAGLHQRGEASAHFPGVTNVPAVETMEFTTPGGLGFGAGAGSTLSATAAAPPPPSAPGQPKGMTLAQRMLEKMGWKEGEGLGKSGQGIAAPLAVQKTDARSGRVVSLEPLGPSSAAPRQQEQQQQMQQQWEEQRPGPPSNAGPLSNVIVLRNVVPPGAVDESLDEEIGIECSKFGEVTSVLIFEVTEPNFPEEEAVRVFVQFTTQQAAAAALAHLHGRFFGGRVVRGKYYDEARFEAGDLAPRPDEVA